MLHSTLLDCKLKTDFGFAYLFAESPENVLKIKKQASIWIILCKWCIQNNFVDWPALRRIHGIQHRPRICRLVKCPFPHLAHNHVIPIRVWTYGFGVSSSLRDDPNGKRILSLRNFITQTRQVKQLNLFN